MAVQTAATTLRESIGSVTMFIVTFTSVADADTYASGLGTNVVSFWAQTAGNPTAQEKAGVAVTNSSGNFVLYPGEDSLAMTLFILARA